VLLIMVIMVSNNGDDDGSNVEFILRLHYLVFVKFCIVVFLLGKC
jgi:hypothetical protein